MLAPLLAQAAPPPTVFALQANWAAVVLLLVVGLLFVVGTLSMSVLVGPSRNNPAKDAVYESGVNPVGDTHKRFNVRFYVVAMIFLVFDVDLVFLYPLCSVFRLTTLSADHALASALLVDLLLFVALLLVAYFYAWGKGVFRFD